MSRVASGTYNILYTTSYGYMKGGGQWSLYYLIKHLNRDVFHPLLLCPEEGELAEKVRALGVEVLFMNTGRIRQLNLFSIWKLVAKMKTLRIHLVHTDSPTQTFYAGIATKILRTPLVWHIRASQHEWLWDRVLASLSSRLVLVAKAITQRFQWLYRTNKLVVVHNGIDVNQFDAISSSAAGLREDFFLDKETLLLGCVGRLEPRKGQEHLISALKYIGAKNTKLLLVGNGEADYVKRLQNLCRESGVSDQVIFTGYREDIPAVLKEIDILAFPTTTAEGFSRVLLEAMTAGIPVVASDDGGNAEAVAHGTTGYIVPAKDTKALADRLDELIKDGEKRKRMGAAGRARVKEMFTMERYVGSIEKLYHEVLSGGVKH